MRKTKSGRSDNSGLWHVVQAFKADRISKEKRIRSPKTSHSNQDLEHLYDIAQALLEEHGYAAAGQVHNDVLNSSCRPASR
eukprot:667147-Karenia_brevis.AAC.1